MNILDVRKNNPIAVFDSGIGGLTVLQSLRRRFPGQDFVYLGDTARLPYGTKSPETIERYAASAVRTLLDYHPSAIVVACNTASSCALPAVQALAPALPVLGMIAPASRAAVKATRNNHIAVIGTEGTIRGGAYGRTLTENRTDVRVTSRACPLLVALAEEGWTEGPITEAVLRRYLTPLFQGDGAPDTLVLGCTHFPLFVPVIRHIVGGGVQLIHCGDALADELQWQMPPAPADRFGECTFLVTDDPERFNANAARIFGEVVSARQVDLGAQAVFAQAA